MNEKKSFYVGNATRKITNGGDEFFKLMVNLDQLKEALNDLEGKNAKFQSRAGNNYLKLEVWPLREEGKYGDTHSIKLDTWKPEPQPRPQAPAPASEPAGETGQKAAADDGLPF